MKRKLITIFTSLTLVVVLLATLCACGSTWGSIKSAYEKEGYYELTVSDTVREKLPSFMQELLDPESGAKTDATIHTLCTVKLSDDPTVTELLSLMTAKYTVIWEYKNLDALEDYYKNNLSKNEQEKADELWEEFQKSDKVNGNCMFISGDEEIFKGTK